MSRKRPRAARKLYTDNAAIELGIGSSTVIAGVTPDVYHSSSDMDDNDLDGRDREDRNSASSSSSAKRRRSMLYEGGREGGISGSGGPSALFSQGPQFRFDADRIPSASDVSPERAVRREDVCTLEDWIHLKEQFSLAEEAYDSESLTHSRVFANTKF